MALTLKRAIELALQNSKDIQVAKLQASLADRSAMITKSQFLPNLYAGSGAGYTYGIPETPGGRAPALFSLTYTGAGLQRAAARTGERTPGAGEVAADSSGGHPEQRDCPHSRGLSGIGHGATFAGPFAQRASKRGENSGSDAGSAQRENLELPVEVTRSQLTKARVVQRILQLEGRRTSWKCFLRSQTGLAQRPRRSR